MKTRSLLLAAITVFSSFVMYSQSAKPLKKVLELKIPIEGGANGAAVAWHPVSKKYYAAMAGNTSYSLSVYDAAGKRLSPEDQTTLFDIRGMWYNTNTKTIQMNGYNESGWAEYKLDGKGLPVDIKELFTGMIQPDEQSTGAYNPKENMVYFLNEEGNIERYSLKDGVYLDDVELKLGKTKDDNADEGDNYDVIEDYNASTAVFTGIAGAEIGLLNYSNTEVELYNIKTGFLSKKFALPNDAPLSEFLNFSYSNGVYWLFDKEARIWKGYK
jgi:hypothetical protein